MSNIYDRIPDFSLVMPSYNEEASLKKTVPSLVECFMRERVDLQLVLVDNGSTDQTGKIIDGLIAEGLPITKLRLEVNQGYGNGIIRGFEHCRAPLVGFLHADGQVSAEDVLTIYRLMVGAEGRVLVKARRKFRRESWRRKIVSVWYNSIMLVLFGWVGSMDINASPKILSRKHLNAMQLVSRDWFLDPEIMIKAKYLNLRVAEVDVEGHPRLGGVSNVRLGTCLEFIKNILFYRIGGYLSSWRNSAETVNAIERLKSSEKASDMVSAGTFLKAGSTIKQAVSHPTQGKVEEFCVANLLERVRVLEQKRHEDPRGFVQKILTLSQCGGDLVRGEVYATTANPGEVKGNHFHRWMGEWFSVIQGDGIVELCDPETGRRLSIPINGSQPCTVYVPAGLAHAVINTGGSPMICIAVAEAEHDPQDVFPYIVWPSTSKANFRNEGMKQGRD